MISAALMIAVVLAAPVDDESPLVLRNAHVRLEVSRSAGGWVETYSAVSGNAHYPLLMGGHPRRAEPSLHVNGKSRPLMFTDATMRDHPGGERTLTLQSSDSGICLTKRITLRGGEGCFRVAVECSVSGSAAISHLLSTYSFIPEGVPEPSRCFPDFVFTPQLRPEENDVIGDHIFRAPALMLQRADRFAALIPDISAIDVRDRAIRSAADLRVDSATVPMFSYGLLPWETRAHVYYRHTDSMAVLLRDTTLRYGYTLFLRSDAPRREAYREVVRFLWDEYGRESLVAAVSPQKEPLSSYAKTAWYTYLPQVALDTVHQGTPVTLLRQGRLAWSNKLHRSADNDSWFNVWFNALRTAYGMSLYASANSDGRLERQAERVLNLALAAPNARGIAPSIFYVDSLGGHWVPDHAWGGIRDGACYAMFHNAWTCYWLLQWTVLAPHRTEEIVAYCRRFGEFLCARQKPTGVIPSWYDPATLEPMPEFRDENAETAGAALFLAELATRTGDQRYAHAAVRAMDYILREIVPESKWFDFETFFSCSRKPLGFFDHYTRQHPQNTLSMHQAAEACLALHALTGKETYAAHGQAILDYLCLYQQVWSPRWLACALFGGFGVQNTDGEWSDSRQAYFAVTLMRYFKLTGRREYLERAAAAARAQFSLFESPASPRTAENYAHTALDRLAGVTGLHWGTGSAVMSLDLLTREFGDVYVDLRDAWGVGINACTVRHVAVDRSTIAVQLRNDAGGPRTIRLMYGSAPPGRQRLVVNGNDLGWIPAEQLQNGTEVKLQ